MNLRIEVPPELEERLKATAAIAHINVEDFVLRTLRDRLDAENESAPTTSQAEPLSRWLSGWAMQFPILPHPIDDSRESIYDGRGE